MANDDTQRVEIMVLAEVVTAASARAKMNHVYLAQVARDIIFKASGNARPIEVPEGEEPPVAHPARRPMNAKTKRVRFMVATDRYQIARDRIRASGKSVTAVLEKGLEKYARTGNY